MASYCSALALLLVLSNASFFANALDIEFDRIQCDETLSAYSSFSEIEVTCNDGKDTRCSFGNDVNIKGMLHYHNLYPYLTNNTGYASANLRLLSVEYNLFDLYPVDFCGDWAVPYNSTYGHACPDWDSYYAFDIDYKLPWDDDDITTWFATGWQGVSNLAIYSNQTVDSELITYCTMHWHTYVTPSEDEGFRTLPSAAVTGLALASFLVALFCCCCYVNCCRRRQKHVTDRDYYDDEVSRKSGYERYEEHAC